MSTTNERPTPETDDAARKGAYLTHGEYPETCGKQIVHIDFARKLERERDEAICDLEQGFMQGTYARLKQLQDRESDYYDMRQQLEALREAVKEAHAAHGIMLNRYVQLVESGDAGNWDPHEEPEVIAAKAAIAKLQPFITTP